MNTQRSVLKHLLFILLSVSLVTGCAKTQWQPVIEKKIEITWPSPPHPPRVHYLGEIHRFQQTDGTLLSSLIGRSKAGNIIKPVAVSVGRDDRIAIADQGRKGIHLYIPSKAQYKFIYKADTVTIDTPTGLAFDNENRLYVTDSRLNIILIFNADGEYLASIEKAGQKPLKRPTGIIFNPSDRKLYVADSLMHTILVFNLHGEFIGQLGSRGEKTGSFNFPTHMGIDNDGDIYVTDSMNFRAQIFSPASKSWKQFGRHGNGSGDFAAPKGIGADSNSIIYIAETLFDNVQLFNKQGTFLLTIGSQGDGPGEFWMPSGIFIDHKDQLYVCDTYNQRIQIFQLATEPLPASQFQEK